MRSNLTQLECVLITKLIFNAYRRYFCIKVSDGWHLGATLLVQWLQIKNAAKWCYAPSSGPFIVRSQCSANRIVYFIYTTVPPIEKKGGSLAPSMNRAASSPLLLSRNLSSPSNGWMISSTALLHLLRLQRHLHLASLAFVALSRSRGAHRGPGGAYSKA